MSPTTASARTPTDGKTRAELMRAPWYRAAAVGPTAGTRGATTAGCDCAETGIIRLVSAEPIRIGLVGAGRILPAHLRGYQLLRQAGIDNFRITAITSRTRRDAESFVTRDAGPSPRPPVSRQPNRFGTHQ